MNDAEMYGIDLDQLRTEHPLHPRQAMIKRLWTTRSQIIWSFQNDSQPFANQNAKRGASEYLKLTDRLGTLFSQPAKSKKLKGH